MRNKEEKAQVMEKCREKTISKCRVSVLVDKALFVELGFWI